MMSSTNTVIYPCVNKLSQQATLGGWWLISVSACHEKKKEYVDI